MRKLDNLENKNLDKDKDKDKGEVETVWRGYPVSPSSLADILATKHQVPVILHGGRLIPIIQIA